MSERIRWRRVVESYPCEVCGTPPGVKCITSSGNETTQPHYLRSMEASRHGWRSPEVEDSPAPIVVGDSGIPARTEEWYASTPE